MSETKPLTPAEARRLWVEALRSGEYEQTDLSVFPICNHRIEGQKALRYMHGFIAGMYAERDRAEKGAGA